MATSPITGFHQDAEGHWVAELACGHNQHMRHQPPWQDRAWVLTAGGRERFIGTEIRCTPCEQMITMEPIGYVRSPYTATDQIPKGCGTEHHAEGVLDVLPAFEPGLLDIEGFSHLYVIWLFDRSTEVALVGRPPTDSRPHGVFATRSPRRPNRIALTVVRLVRRDGTKLHVAGVDMLDGSPILDIKPYLSSVAAGELRRGWLDEAEAARQK
jgi:tRNA (adenine37-N6)-methyltransferase